MMEPAASANRQGYRQRFAQTLDHCRDAVWTSGRWRALCAVLVGAATQAACAAPGLAPHSASYSLSRHWSSDTGDITDVRGTVMVRFEALCDGWRYEQLMAFRLYGDSGQQLEHVTYLSGVESDDGRRFSFNTHSYEDRELAEAVTGRAQLEPDAGTAQFEQPEGTPPKRLPAGTVFPIAHLEELLSAMASGRRHLSRTVFDGSTVDSPFEISTFIGEPREATNTAALGPGRGPVWPLSIAYFPIAAVDPSPEFEMHAELYDNGVAGDMVYDYGDVAMNVRLQEVNMLEYPSCP